MEAMATGVKTRPFHETIIEAIGRCPSPRSNQIFNLLELIKETTIPKGHDEIIAAIEEYFNIPNRQAFARDIREVKENLLARKRASEEKLANQEKGVNLDELQQEVERILNLLKDRQPGLFTWNGFMHERLQSLYVLISKALGKN